MRTFAVVLALSLIAVRAVAAPIHDAAGKGDLAKVKALLSKDAKLLNLRDADGAAPLHFAVAGGQKAVVEFLLLKKADVNVKKDDGVTPLHIAAALGKTEIAKLLLAKGANKDAADSKGRTPLTLAGEKGDADLISLLSGKAAPPKPGVKVISISAGASVVRAGKKLAGVKKGTELKLGDVIENGKSGDLVIHIGDTAAIRLKPGARLKLTKLILTGDLDIRADLEKGDALARVRALTGQSRFQMASPGAIVAVKGTAFALKVKGSESTVVVAEGKVGVSLPSDPSKETELLENERLTVAGGSLGLPEPVTAEDSPIIQEMLSEPPPASVNMQPSPAAAPDAGTATSLTGKWRGELQTQGVLEFKADGTFEGSDPTKRFSGTYTVAGNVLTQRAMIDGKEIVEVTVWEIVDDTFLAYGNSRSNKPARWHRAVEGSPRQEP